MISPPLLSCQDPTKQTPDPFQRCGKEQELLPPLCAGTKHRAPSETWVCVVGRGNNHQADVIMWRVLKIKSVLSDPCVQCRDKSFLLETPILKKLGF